MKSLLRATVCLVLAACALSAVAQNAPPRGGKWEFTLQPQYTGSKNLTGSNGSQGHMDSALGFGLGFAYNLNSHFSIGGEFVWSQADYNVTFAQDGNPSNTVSVKGTAYTDTFRMNATWNFLQSDVTPYVTGGIGSTYVNTNIPNGPPTNVCWWDPWWGYYCGVYTPTKTSTDVSYMAGFGLRWDVERSFFLRAQAMRLWVNVGGDPGTPWWDQYRIDIGFKF